MQDENQTQPESPPQEPAASESAPLPPEPVPEPEKVSPDLPAKETGVPVETSTVAEPAQPEAPGWQPTEPPPPAPVSTARSIRERQPDALAKRRQKRQQKLDRIVELAHERKRLANDQVEKALRISDATASRYLAELVREGRLKRVGSPEHAYYEPIM